MSPINLGSNFFKSLFLAPMAFFWGLITKTRRIFYKYDILKKEYFRVPIISIGNLTFGGTGKTPFTIWLGNYLSSRGLKSCVLTRGYKGNLENGVGVISGGDTFRFNPINFGDEALLLARKLKEGTIVVGKKRSKNLINYFEEINPDIVLLDDGFQHLQLHRNLNIALFDSCFELDKYKIAPLGMMRENMSALKDADAIVLSRVDQVNKEKLGRLTHLLKSYARPNTPLIQMKYRPKGIFDGNFREVMKMDDLQGKNVFAIAGLASPKSFLSLLEFSGAKIVGQKIYPDHYYYRPSDINEILVQASSLGALVLTTEKDIVKIRRISTDLRILYVDIDVEIVEGQTELEELISNLIIG